MLPFPEPQSLFLGGRLPRRLTNPRPFLVQLAGDLQFKGLLPLLEGASLLAQLQFNLLRGGETLGLVGQLQAQILEFHPQLRFRLLARLGGEFGPFLAQPPLDLLRQGKPAGLERFAFGGQFLLPGFLGKGAVLLLPTGLKLLFELLADLMGDGLGQGHLALAVRTDDGVRVHGGG
ncbi:MAG: hypothetical protein IPM17_00010 [Verrucomicrobia bacterium]|nr:hypothetical protein [Verrucomicrobiota bacterium]